MQKTVRLIAITNICTCTCAWDMLTISYLTSSCGDMWDVSKEKQKVWKGNPLFHIPSSVKQNDLGLFFGSSWSDFDPEFDSSSPSIFY